MKKTIIYLTIIMLVGLIHFFIEYKSNEKIYVGPLSIPSVSFSPFEKNQGPENTIISRERIERSLRAIKAITNTIRIYSIDEGLHQIISEAEKLGINVILGIWLDKSEEHNQKEVDKAIELSKYPNVISVVVGNEVLLSETVKKQDLVRWLRYVRSKVEKPVTTAEPAHIWIDHKDLESEVDFVMVHLLPFWDGLTYDNIEGWLNYYDKKMKETFSKDIYIGEFGWPSGPRSITDSRASNISQSLSLRFFSNWAKNHNYQWNLIEGIDQTWKINEGPSGPHWGVFDIDLKEKESLREYINLVPYWKQKLSIAIILGTILSCSVFLIPTSNILAVFITISSHLFSSLIAYSITWPLEQYLSFGEKISFVVFLPFLILFGFIANEKIKEILCSICLKKEDQKKIDNVYEPFVSIHVPVCRENVDVVLSTLKSLINLDYKNYEIIVIVNNTKDLAQDLISKIQDPKLKIFDYPSITGFKAGALNRALNHTNIDATIVALVDADYIVEVNWLKENVSYFLDQKIAFVQNPQEHNRTKTIMDKMFSHEARGFFDDGMRRRSEDNALILHGTMVLIKKDVLEEVKWDESQICEDTHLGLILLEKGYKGIYNKTRYGYGLVPASFEALCKQRWRWAYGAMRIMIAHFKRDKSKMQLNIKQRYHFLLGWNYWIQDLLNLILSIGLVFWSYFVVFGKGAPPPTSVIVLLLAGTLINVIQNLIIYSLHVDKGKKQIFSSMIISMALQSSVAKGVLSGLIFPDKPFIVTQKVKENKHNTWYKIKNNLSTSKIEVFIVTGLISGYLFLNNYPLHGRENTDLFSILLLIQAFPFLLFLILKNINILDNLKIRKKSQF